MKEYFKTLKTYKKGDRPKLKVDRVNVPLKVRTQLVKEVLPHEFLRRMEFLGLTDEIFNGNERIPNEIAYKEKLEHYLKLYPTFEEFIFESCHWRNVKYYVNYELEANDLYKNDFQYLYYAVFGEKLPLIPYENWLNIADNHKKYLSDYIREIKFGKIKYKTKVKSEITDKTFDIVLDNGYFGTKNQKGELIIPFMYSHIEKLPNGKLKVQKDNKWGLIDSFGKEIIPIEFNQIDDFIDKRAKVNKYNQWGYIDENGNEVIPIKYSKIHNFINGKAKVEVITTYYFPDYSEATLHGYINMNGEEIIPVVYSGIGEFKNGIANASIRSKIYKSYDFETNETVVEYGNLYGMIDANGKTVIDFKYREFEYFGVNKTKARNFSIHNYESAKWGVFDEKGDIIIPFEYDSIVKIDNKKILAQKNKKCGVLNNEGMIVIPFEYNSIDEFKNGIAKAQKNKKWGVFNDEGIIVIPFEYDSIDEFENGEAKAQKNGFCGVLNEDGSFNVPFENIYYEKLETFISEVSKNDRSRCKIDEKIKKDFLVTFDFDKVNNELEYFNYLLSISDFRNEFFKEFDYKHAEEQLKLYNYIIECELDICFKESNDAKITNKENFKSGYFNDDTDYTFFNEDRDMDQQSEEFWNQF
jgi:hypothetical protein